MLYIIVEKHNGQNYLINDEVYQTKEKAEIERIYLQPDYDNLLVVEPII